MLFLFLLCGWNVLFIFRYAVFVSDIQSFDARKVSIVAPSLAALSLKDTFTLRGAKLRILFDAANFSCGLLIVAAQIGVGLRTCKSYHIHLG